MLREVNTIVETHTTHPQVDRATMTEKEFAAAVGLSITTCWALRKQGRLPHFKVGRRVLYSQDHVQRFLASVEQPLKAA